MLAVCEGFEERGPGDFVNRALTNIRVRISKTNGQIFNRITGDLGGASGHWGLESLSLHRHRQ
jgi:hypothetical protein